MAGAREQLGARHRFLGHEYSRRQAMTGLWWARRDLRLADNPALLSAQQPGSAGAIFAWSEAITRWPGRRRAHLARVLRHLRASSGASLAVRRGPAPQVVAQAAAEMDAPVVWAAHEFTPSGIAEQVAVATALAEDGRQLRLIGSPYAVSPGSVTKANGDPYQVFTPYRRAWRHHGWDTPAPSADPGALVPLPAHHDDVDLDLCAADGDERDPLDQTHEHREDHVLAHLNDFVAQGLEHYADQRDRPDLDTTSHLSAALAFGLIHPRTIVALTGRHSDDSARTFESELAWREFHADVLFHHPHALRQSLTPVLKDSDWATGAEANEAFCAWRDGLTGFALVDAGMRQLARTGWMHNRVRMVAASLLVKDLRVPWQWGAEHFRQTLVDYDHAQNQLNWQWVAGTGRDAAPFFRIFNPDTQATKFDPEGRYRARWIPELGTPDYPAPLVDHAHERRVTLEMYQRARGHR